MKILDTKIETGQFVCHEWEEMSKGTIFTPGRYTTSDTFKIVNYKEEWLTLFGFKIWRKKYETDFDEQKFITVDDIKNI